MEKLYRKRGAKVELYELLFILMGGYVLGSLPVGFFVGRLKHIRVEERGSESPGATNVGRLLGWRYGFLTLMLDAVKCLAGVWLIHFYIGEGWPIVLFLTAVVVGNRYSWLLKFRGGKGVAVLVGGLILVISWPYLLLAVLWAGLLWLTNKMSVTNLVVVAILPVLLWLGYLGGFEYALAYKLFGMFAAAAVFWTHRENIGRILRGEEPNVFPARASILDRVFPLPYTQRG